MRKVLISAVAALALGTVGAQAAPFHFLWFPHISGCVNVNANNNQAAICQDGVSNQSPVIDQVNHGGTKYSTATIKQAWSWNNKAKITQEHGSDHQHGTILQLGGHDNEAYITQRGDDNNPNYAFVYQAWGKYNDANIKQDDNADNDKAAIVQIGGTNTDADIYQGGDNNKAAVVQLGGKDNYANIDQNDNNGNAAVVVQDDGHNNTAKIDQTTNGNSAVIVTEGGSNNHPQILQ
jgi:hypothetical protein